MRWILVAAGAIALAGCSAEKGQPAGNDSVLARAPGTADWSPFMDKTIDGWFAVDPSFAVYEGRHEYDGRLPDWSPAGLKAHSDFLKQTVQQARAFDGLTADQQFERDYLVKVAEGQLFWLEDAQSPAHNPTYYLNNGLDPNVYIARNYADAPARMRAMISLLRQVPAATGQIKANLKLPMPASFIDQGVSGFGGLASYYSGDVKAAFADVAEPKLQKDLADASAAASASMRDLAKWFDANRATATQDYALGRERFLRMLKTTEDVDIDLPTLKQVGIDDLHRNQQALTAECAKYAPGADIPTCVAKMGADKPKGEPVSTAREQIGELQAFVTSHDIVTIPGGETIDVKEAPPYNRQNFAYMDPPAPFERNPQSAYYIAPPDPSWTKAVQQDYLPGKADLLFTTVHEVMPGHFQQFLHSNRVASDFGKLFVGYAFAEGWAHYSEEMMWDAGLHAGDLETHIGQISNALLRDCRFLSAIGLHAEGMTQAQSEAMFKQQCYQDEGNAKQQAARGTYDPAYLNYTLGKLMIRKLRTDWTASRGGRKAWKAFHDQFLSYGGPPIPLIRQRMMAEDSAKAVF